MLATLATVFARTGYVFPIIDLPHGDDSYSMLQPIYRDFWMNSMQHFCTYRMHVTLFNYNLHSIIGMFIGDPCGYVRFFGPLLSVHFVELTSPISVGFIMCIMLYLCFGWLYTGYYIINDYVKFSLVCWLRE